LVVATGLKQAPAKISGLDEAWAEFMHPVFANVDHPR